MNQEVEPSTEKTNFKAPDEPENEQPNRRKFLKMLAHSLPAIAIGAYGVKELLKGDEQKSAAQQKAAEGKIETSAKQPEASKELTLEQRKTAEVKKAENLIKNADPERFLDSPYLVSALYYSDAFLDKLDPHKPLETDSSEIIAQIKELLTPEIKKAYVEMLKDRVIKAMGDRDANVNVKPLDNMDFGQGENHPDALDIFTDEGSSVKSITRGIAVLAENGWKAEDPLSTASAKGGNSVIIFSPDNETFYRYCHLSGSSVKTGEIVEPGHILGKVGHTGTNASKPGHGRHLHLEINQKKQGGIISEAFSNRDIENKISQIG